MAFDIENIFLKFIPGQEAGTLDNAANTTRRYFTVEITCLFIELKQNHKKWNVDFLFEFFYPNGILNKNMS